MTAQHPSGSPGALFSRIGTPERMRALARYDLDSASLRSELDEVAEQTSARVGAPISFVNLVLDTVQVLAGRHGLPTGHWTVQADGMPAEWSICAYAVEQRTPYVRTDLSRDPLHADSPLVAVEGLVSYAGMPVLDADGLVLGMHCVMDVRPRQFTADHLVALREGAARSAEILDRHRL